MQRLLRDNVESEEGDEVFDDIRYDGFFDCGCDTNNAGTTAVDCKCATNPSYRVACLSFGKASLKLRALQTNTMRVMYNRRSAVGP